MTVATLTAAAACAAFLMGAAPVLPDRWVETVPGPRWCAAVGHPGCAGMTVAWADGSVVVYAPNYWPLLVEESCHVQQARRDGVLADPECDAIRARVAECPEGL